MSIFPAGGVSASDAGSLEPAKDLVSGNATYFPNDCAIPITSEWLNCMIAEILCVINEAAPEGVCYDPASMCNLKDAIVALINAAFTGGTGGLCSLPTLSPDNNDLIAGCFDGVQGLTTISDLAALMSGSAVCGSIPTTNGGAQDDPWTGFANANCAARPVVSVPAGGTYQISGGPGNWGISILIPGGSSDLTGSYICCG